ncbi:hypothetical protein FANTH_6867 [Fusarium anthophilum]|uniref:Vault poly n=1 Tax=Fusarium anthophilum TaxID=48485 RepID=A0A8H5E4H7_9HYPO|nr:hypothetical protein FANTH_6867 [Fusarium anthophilum]
MASRHVFTQRLKSGVIFSAPGNLLAMPEGGWGDDTPIIRQKKPKRKAQGRGLDHFSHWVAKATPYNEPYDDIGSFTPVKDTRGIENEYRPYSISPYPEPEVETGTAKIPEATLCLPMLSVSLTATVDGTVAHTELVQKFHNPSDIIIDAAKHVFPIYDGAVITSFECTIGDERRVRGVVKPKVQARKEFEEAVRDKVSAPALLEEHTPEIFETSLGNIPANTTVEIKITYVQELKVVMMESEATEGIALTIPMSIAPRYSKAPIEWEPASKVPEERLDIWIKVLDNGNVNQEGCEEESGHLLQFEGSKPAEYSNLLDKDASPKTYYVWHHESEPPVLRKDFVFVIQMNEGHQIKSGAIACPADDKGLAALRVNIRPNDLFRNAIIPQSFTGEILFLLDQSGSMGWSNGSYRYDRRHTAGRKIDVMREAMLLALSGIPSTCVFNIISWGSATVGLWEGSRAHTQENIREAKTYVSQIEANMGGTDLLRALESTVKRRVKDKSTQIIILTDGELEPEDSIQFIWKKRQLFGDSIRFFALGIGDEVSHRLVESIAECGGGYSDVVHTTQTPRWHDRLNRLLKSALEPNSWSCDIDFGSGFERKSLIDYKVGEEDVPESGKTPYIQAPFPISSLHPFSFASISFLIDLRHGGKLPKSVTISTTTAGAKKKTYELPVEISSDRDGTVHRLVAKSVLLDLQDQIKREETETQIAKVNAENIGTMYSITSKWTSFVAISENQPTQTVEEQKMNHYKALFDEIDIDELLNNVSDDGSSSCGSSGSSGHGAPWSYEISHLGAPQMYNYPTGHHSATGRVIESASGIPVPAYVMSPQHNLLDNNGRACPSFPTNSTPRQLHPMIHVQPAPDPKSEKDNFPVSGQSLAYPSSPNNEATEAQREQGSRPYDGSSWPYSSDNGEDLLAHSRFDNKQSHSKPSRPSMRSVYSPQFGSIEPFPIPAHMPQYSPARPPSGMSLPPGFIDDSQGGRSALRQCSLDEDNDEPEAPRPAGSPVMHDPEQEEPQGYGDRILSWSSRVRSNSASRPRPWEIQDSVESRAQATSVDDDVRLPTRERVHEGDSSAFIGHDFPLYPNDSNRRKPEVLGLMQSKTTDNSQPDLAPLAAEFSEPPEVAVVAAKPPSDEAYAQKASAAMGSKSAYPVPEGSFRARRRYSYDSEGNGDDNTAQAHQPYHKQHEDSTQEDVADEPMVSPRANRGFAIATEMVERTPAPADASDSDDNNCMMDNDPRHYFQYSAPPEIDSHRCPITVSEVLGYSWQNMAMLDTDEESEAGGPKFPTHNPRPILKSKNDANVTFETEFDSYDASMNRGVSESPSSQSEVYGPLDWQFAIECQDGEGLFDLDEKRSSLRLHFCPETAAKISPKVSKVLHNSTTPEQERDDMCARLLDTLMMIECYKTHRAQEEDAWDLIMERAWDAVISVLGLSDEEETLEELVGQLSGAMMHAHFVAATGIKDSEKDDCSADTPLTVDISVSDPIVYIMDPDKTSTDGTDNMRGSTGSQPLLSTPDMDRRIRRAFDRRVMPVVCCLYVLSYLDRGNIGNAKTAGAQEALNLSSDDWAWVLNSFYLAYILFEWTTMLWKIFPAHIYVSILCVWMSILLGMSPLANTFASSLAYGITHIKGSLAPWRLLFIIEGAPTIAFAPVVYFFLIDSPATAKFLTEEERYFAVQRVQGPDGAKKNVNWKQIIAGILDYKNYVHAVIHFCCNFSFAALSNFLPTIVNAMGYSSINAQGLTAPAYFTAFLLCMGAAFFSDRWGNRGFVVAGFAALATVGYGLLAGIQDIHRPGPRYAGVWLAACGIFPALCINITWLLNNQGRDSKKGAGLAITLIIGQCSSLLSSYMFPKEDSPFFVKGCAIGCGMSGAIVILALLMHFALERENKRNEKLYGPLDNDAEVDAGNDGEQSSNFRYLT